MKARLSYKLFAAFLAMSFMVVVLMAVSYRYVVVTGFWDYINQHILSRLNYFSSALSAEYRSSGDWQRLKTDPQTWFNLMAESLPKDDFGRWGQPPEKEDDPRHLSSFKKYFRRPPASDDGLNPAKNTNKDANKDANRDRPGNIEDKPHFLSLRLARGLSLFDIRMNFLVGNDTAVDADRYTLRAIVADKKTVGWLGLLRRENMIDPLFMDFIKEQSLTFYSIGFAILLLAAVVSLLVSRHLLKPIRQLTQGTRALTTFRFDTRIPIRSKDELGQLAKDFNRMADTLKKYESIRKQWISDISHELRTPLAILKGEIEALQDGVRKVDPGTLDSLHSEVLRLSKLVADLHALSLADTQNLQTARNDVRPLEILAKMVSHFRDQMKRSRIDLMMNFGQNSDPSSDPASGPVIRGDHDRLAQLFANLLENSLRYTDAPGILKIYVRQDTQRITIWFEDSAPGVPQDSLQRIFERLYRVDSSRNRRLGGSGLGLAICKQIASSHGGTIKADAAQAGGLRIRIDLPLKDAGWKPSIEPCESSGIEPLDQRPGEPV